MQPLWLADGAVALQVISGPGSACHAQFEADAGEQFRRLLSHLGRQRGRFLRQESRKEQWASYEKQGLDDQS